MNNDSSVKRVHYFDRQYLRRQDFADEQAYHVAMRRRHNITHHGWGIVAGLEIAIEEGNVVVRPGMAIDGYGRELVLPARQAIDVEHFVRLNSNRLDVWLVYDVVPESAPPAGYVACGDTAAAGATYRGDEIPRIALERAPVTRVNARRPRATPSVILDLPVQLETPDDPLVRWDIYLGRIIYQPEAKGENQRFVVDSTDRPYVGVTAEIIDHSHDVARVEIGRRSAQPDTRVIDGKTYTYAADSERAFAIFVRSKSDATDLRPRFEIDVDADASNHLRGQTTVHGNLLIQGEARFSRMVTVDDTIARESPCVYRAKNPLAANNDELRIDLGDAVANGRSFVLGLTAEDGSFVPAVTVQFRTAPGAPAPTPLVTIHGDLKLDGLLQSPEVLERGLTKATLDALLASFQAGSIAAGGQ